MPDVQRREESIQGAGRVVDAGAKEGEQGGVSGETRGGEQGREGDERTRGVEAKDDGRAGGEG